jgi:hypothetical protein
MTTEDRTPLSPAGTLAISGMKFKIWLPRLAFGTAALFPQVAAAQQTQPQQQAIPQQQRPAPWANMPHMQLERQFSGPLQDTIVQRWRDPTDGTVCYIYLPITVAHGPPLENGYVQYGANTIGSISCFGQPAGAAAKPPPQR